MRGLLALLTAITLGIGRVYGELPVSGFWGAEMLGRYETPPGRESALQCRFLSLQQGIWQWWQCITFMVSLGKDMVQ